MITSKLWLETKMTSISWSRSQKTWVGYLRNSQETQRNWSAAVSYCENVKSKFLNLSLNVRAQKKGRAYVSPSTRELDCPQQNHNDQLRWDALQGEVFMTAAREGHRWNWKEALRDSATYATQPQSSLGTIKSSVCRVLWKTTSYCKWEAELLQDHSIDIWEGKQRTQDPNSRTINERSSDEASKVPGERRKS